MTVRAIYVYPCVKNPKFLPTWVGEEDRSPGWLWYDLDLT